MSYYHKYRYGARSSRDSSQRRSRVDHEESQNAAEGSRFECIREDVAELKLVVATMLNMLVNQGLLSRDALIRAAPVIDGMDGRVDGKLHATVLVDGKLKAEKPPPRNDLDELSDAAMNSV